MAGHAAESRHARTAGQKPGHDKATATVATATHQPATQEHPAIQPRPSWPRPRTWLRPPRYGHGDHGHPNHGHPNHGHPEPRPRTTALDSASRSRGSLLTTYYPIEDAEHEWPGYDRQRALIESGRRTAPLAISARSATELKAAPVARSMSPWIPRRARAFSDPRADDRPAPIRVGFPETRASQGSGRSGPTIAHITLLWGTDVPLCPRFGLCWRL